MSMRRLIGRLSEDYGGGGGGEEGDDYTEVVLAKIAERLNRKGPKGVLYAMDDLLIDASKNPWQRSLLVKAFKKIADDNGVEGYRFNSAMQKTMSRYIEAANKGSNRIAADPEAEAEYEVIMRKFGK